MIEGKETLRAKLKNGVNLVASPGAGASQSLDPLFFLYLDSTHFAL